MLQRVTSRPQTPGSKYDYVRRLHVIYLELEKTPGWDDFLGRLRDMRTVLVTELLHGTIDKYGNNRDDEKRAALNVLDRMLLFPSTIHTKYADLTKRMETREDKAKQHGIHDKDFLTAGWGESPGV